MHGTRRICSMTALALLMLSGAAGGAHAATVGDSAAAKPCQKGGWLGLVTSEGAAFANQGECVSYAAKGGTPSSKPTASLVFDLGTCEGDGSQALCPNVTLIGYGLMPGNHLEICEDNPSLPLHYCYPFANIDADGTPPDTLDTFPCRRGSVYTVFAPTRDGATIEASDSC